MKNEIVKQNSSQLPPQSQAPMNITASGDATAIGNIYGDVNIEASQELLAQAILLVAQHQANPQQKSHSIEWVRLDRERFHLFVLANEDYSGSSF